MPKLYVGTYAKYNNGDLTGAWLNLEDYADEDDFLTACLELHSDEEDPELMFQDKEDIPDSMYSESSVSAELFEWVHMGEDDKELLAIYRDNIDSDGTLKQAKENYLGKYYSPEDWAAEWLEETGSLSQVPESLRNYIDFASYANDCRCCGDVTFVDLGYHDTRVFSNR